MSNYAANWAAAKSQFEATTGMSKPANKGKLLFIEWRKGNKIDSILSGLDKLVGPGEIAKLPEAKLKEVQTVTKTLQSAATAYVQVLNTSIDKEKADKDNSTSYRALKVLRAELDKTVSEVANQVNHAILSKDQVLSTYEGNAQKTVVVLHNLSFSLKAACAAGTAAAQKVLANPTPEAFNGMFDKHARDITQPMTNILKFAFPEELDPDSLKSKSLQSVLKDDPRLYLTMTNMKKAVTSAKQLVTTKFKDASGSTPLDANLVRMANNQPKLKEGPNGDTPDTVKLAIKNYIKQVKEVLPLIDLLAKAGQ